MQLSKTLQIRILRLIIVSSIILISGYYYQRHAQLKDEKLAPGAFINVKDHKFHLYCKGEGSPTVILESGHNFDYHQWIDIIEKSKHTTKVCTYDRLGLGWSSAIDKPLRAVDIANNLHSLLLKANIKFPFVLAGWSSGGLYARKYYELFPESVAGLILIDSSHEQQDLRAKRIWGKTNSFSRYYFCDLISWTGIFRITNYHEYNLSKYMSQDISNVLSEELFKETVAIRNRTGFCSGKVYSNGLGEDLVSKSPPKGLGNLPTIVIRAGIAHLQHPNNADYYKYTWNQFQDELALLSSNTTNLVAEKSGHLIHAEQPEIIVNSINNMVNSVRNNINKTLETK